MLSSTPPKPYLLIKIISPRNNFTYYYSSIRIFQVNAIYSAKDNNEIRSVQLDFCLVGFYAGFVNGHLDEYDTVNAIVSSRTSLGNVSLVVKEFNTSNNTSLFNIGEIYKRNNLIFTTLLETALLNIPGVANRTKSNKIKHP